MKPVDAAGAGIDRIRAMRAEELQLSRSLQIAEPGPENLTIIQRLSATGWTTMTVIGEVDSTTSGQLEEALTTVLSVPETHLAIDLSGVRLLDSAGLTTLITAQHQAHRNNGGVWLVGPSTSVRRLFEITGFDQVFMIHASLPELLSCPGCNQALTPKQPDDDLEASKSAVRWEEEPRSEVS